MNLRLELMGPENEMILPAGGPLVVDNKTGGVWDGTKRTFVNKEITIPAHTVTEAGAYRLVTILQFYDEFDHPQPLVGFWEGPMIFFYKEEL